MEQEKADEKKKIDAKAAIVSLFTGVWKTIRQKKSMETAIPLI